MKVSFRKIRIVVVLDIHWKHGMNGLRNLAKVCLLFTLDLQVYKKMRNSKVAANFCIHNMLGKEPILMIVRDHPS